MIRTKDNALVLVGLLALVFAPGTITLGNIGAVDGVVDRSFRDILCAARFFMCVP